MKQNMAYALCSEVRHTTAFDEGVVLRQKSGEVLVLNEVGIRILVLIEEGVNTLESIVDAVVDSYDTDRPTLLTDVEDYLTQLERAGVIETVPVPD